MGNTATGHASVVEIDDPAVAFEMFDVVCQRELRITAKEFLDRWDSGDYRDVDADSIDGLSEVVGALPLVR